MNTEQTIPPEIWMTDLKTLIVSTIKKIGRPALPSEVAEQMPKVATRSAIRGRMWQMAKEGQLITGNGRYWIPG